MVCVKVGVGMELVSGEEIGFEVKIKSLKISFKLIVIGEVIIEEELLPRSLRIISSICDKDWEKYAVRCSYSCSNIDFLSWVRRAANLFFSSRTAAWRVSVCSGEEKHEWKEMLGRKEGGGLVVE